MNGPRRLLDESESPLERALLHAGTSYRSSRRTRAKTLAALGISGSAVLSAGAANGASIAPVAKAGWAKLIVAVTAVGAATAVPAGYYAWHRAHEVSSTAARVHERAIVVARAPAAANATARDETTNMPPAAPVPVPAAAPVRAPTTDNAAQSPKPVSRSAEPKSTESKPPATSAVLKAELTALDAARSALADGDSKRALSLLDAYARANPHGRLELEAEVLRIDALAKNGQPDAAKKRAEAFLRRHPNSVLTSRVRAYLDD